MNWFRSLGSTAQGIVLMSGAMAVLALMDSFAKLLMQTHDPLQVIWARYFCQSLVMVIWFAPRLHRLLVTRHIRLQLVRSAFLFCGTFFFFHALAHIGLADAAAIFDINPLIITVLAMILLKERVGPRRLSGVGLGLIGALIIIRPGSDVFSPFAILPALAACCIAGYVITTRFLGRDENVLTSLLYSTLIGTIAASFLVPPVWQTPSVQHAGLMMLLGLLGAAGHFLLIRAFTLADAAAIAPFSYVGLLFSVIYGYLFFDDLPDAMTFIGALVIVGSGLYVWHRERQAERGRTS